MTAARGPQAPTEPALSLICQFRFPYVAFIYLQRVAVGIWSCKRCNKTKAGGAYVYNTAASGECSEDIITCLRVSCFL